MNTQNKNSSRIVHQALSHQKPDRLPIFINAFWDEFVEKWHNEKYPDPNACIEDYYNNDLCVLVAQEEFFPTRKKQIKQTADDRFIDDGWGRIVRQKLGTAIAEPVEHRLTSPAELDNITFDPPNLNMRYTDFTQQVSLEKSKGRPVFVKIGGPFIRSSFFRGEAQYLMDLAADEQFANALTRKVADHLLQVGLESLRRADAYDNGIWIFDDMCTAKAPIFSPKTFEKIFLPIYKNMVAALKNAGAAFVILHCDGNLLPFLDMLIEAGIDGINPVEHAAGLKVPDLIQTYGDRLSFIGGLCNTNILPSGDPKRIADHVKTIARAGRNGGLIIGTHSIGPDISVDTMDLIYKILRQEYDD